MRKRIIYAFVGTMMTLCGGWAQAQEFRVIQPIITPVAADAPLAEGAQPVKEIVPVDRDVIEQAMAEIAGAWNTPEMSRQFADSFYDKDRLTDTLNAYAPVDARLRLLSVGSYRVLAQQIMARDGEAALISRVSVIARTQLEYYDPVNGFQRRPGEQEYIIKITQKVSQ